MLYAHAGHTTKKKLFHDNVAGTACLIAMVRAQVSLRTGKIGSKFGTKVKVDSKIINRYNHELTGTRTSNGKTISQISGHAVGRSVERGISIRSVKEVLRKYCKYHVEGRKKNGQKTLHIHER